MQNTKEGIQTFPHIFELVSEPLMYNNNSSFLSWNENNNNICQNIQEQEFNQFCDIPLLQQQNNYEKQNIIEINNKNSLLLDLNSNLLSEQFSSYNINMIDENDQFNISQQQLNLNNNIQASQQNELLLITKSNKQIINNNIQLNNNNNNQSSPSTTNLFLPSFTNNTEQINNNNNIPQFLSNISSSSTEIFNNNNNLINRKNNNNIVNNKKPLSARRLNGGRKRKSERNNNNQIIYEQQNINEKEEKVLLYKQIINDIKKLENIQMSNDLIISPKIEQNEKNKIINNNNNISSNCGFCEELIEEFYMLSLSKKIKEEEKDNNLIIKKENLQQKQQFYHLKCLKCLICKKDLQEDIKCYINKNNIFCPDCYFKNITETKKIKENIKNAHCAMCEKQISNEFWVRKARQWLYHLTCFYCEHCQRQLNTDEQFALDETVLRKSNKNNGLIPRLLCKQHYLELVLGEQCSPKPKAKRIRTTFGEDQLNILQENFKVDSNPDGTDLERIARLTGLTKRVTQVWFQNSRARQKKYTCVTNGNDGNTLIISKTNSNSSSTFCRSITTTPISSSPNGPNSPFEAVIFGDEDEKNNNINNEKIEEEEEEQNF